MSLAAVSSLPVARRGRAAAALPFRGALVRSRGDRRYVLHGASWRLYKQLQAHVEKHGGGRVSFLDGTIELMALSLEHENRKSLIGGLCELYLDELDIPFFHHGSATLQSALKKSGKEPDESYCFHSQKEHPDLVIEVAISRSALNTLEIYRRFRVSEVWIWRRGQVQVFVLTGKGYETRERSACFPKLDLSLIARCAGMEDANSARKAFRAGLRSKR